MLEISLLVFNLSLYGLILHTRANYIGTYCLKWIPDHYKHRCPRWRSNPQIAEMKNTALVIQPQLV